MGKARHAVATASRHLVNPRDIHNFRPRQLQLHLKHGYSLSAGAGSQIDLQTQQGGHTAQLGREDSWAAVRGTAWSASILSDRVLGLIPGCASGRATPRWFWQARPPQSRSRMPKSCREAAGGYLGADTVGNSCRRRSCRALQALHEAPRPCPLPHLRQGAAPLLTLRVRARAATCLAISLPPSARQW